MSCAQYSNCAPVGSPRAQGADVQPGNEERLRPYLEGAVQQAHAEHPDANADQRLLDRITPVSTAYSGPKVPIPGSASGQDANRRVVRTLNRTRQGPELCYNTTRLHNTREVSDGGDGGDTRARKSCRLC
jgi:hypothetical protein